MNDPLPTLPPRAPAGHKGTFGRVAVVGGCCAGPVRMIGAPALAALGALRAGAGLVRLVAPAPILNDAIGLCPSATGLALPTLPDGVIHLPDAVPIFDAALHGADAVIIGPGMGEFPAVAALTLRAIQHTECPVVIDADALNALAATPDLFRDFRARAVLTPHPGEYRRLATALRIHADPTNTATRPTAAELLAQRLGCIVVLKGAGSIVSDGHTTWRCDHANPCLATAGTGDVLAGVLAGLLAAHGRSGTPRLFDLVRLAVEAHARAARAWADAHHTESGMVAVELAELIPPALESLRR
ncbi:MAG: hypothetical protein HBSAPP03_21470 [Phycisphaerae bacterium]|nr:MAG: hypothetical protein HBSAPP03_21470 [Phycisphaerae bacterium]